MFFLIFVENCYLSGGNYFLWNAFFHKFSLNNVHYTRKKFPNSCFQGDLEAKIHNFSTERNHCSPYKVWQESCQNPIIYEFNTKCLNKHWLNQPVSYNHKFCCILCATWKRKSWHLPKSVKAKICCFCKSWPVAAKRTHDPTNGYRPWGNWRGDKGASFPAGKLMVKSGPPLADKLIFSILWFSVGCFFAFSVFFRFLANVDIPHIRIHNHFLTFFVSVSQWLPYGGQWAPFSKVFPPLAQTSIYATEYRWW